MMLMTSVVLSGTYVEAEELYTQTDKTEAETDENTEEESDTEESTAQVTEEQEITVPSAKTAPESSVNKAPQAAGEYEVSNAEELKEAFTQIGQQTEDEATAL